MNECDNVWQTFAKLFNKTALISVKYIEPLGECSNNDDDGEKHTKNGSNAAAKACVERCVLQSFANVVHKHKLYISHEQIDKNQ